MFRLEVKQKIELELTRGEAARQTGFIGRARVCARRAAGAAIREYLEIIGIPSPGPGVMDLLQAALGLPGLPAGSSQVLQRLLMRVDEGFSLPDDVDLIEDARWLAQVLDNQSDNDSQEVRE
jgi:hypothetical protein